MQISALLWANDPQLESEAIRVANEIRKGGETMPAGEPDRSDTRRLWHIYIFQLLYRGKPQFLSALSPADHLATFRWLYPENKVSKENYAPYLCILARLQELNGERTNALASYRMVRSQVGNSPGSLLDRANEGIQRLSK
jgi:hypothetical protein